MLKKHYFQVIVLHFIITYGLEVIWFLYLYGRSPNIMILLCISSQLCIQ